MNKLVLIGALFALTTIAMAQQTSAFKANVLNLHNIVKTSINYTNFTWSDNLAQGAQTWANTVASKGVFSFSYTLGVGENIAFVDTLANTDMTTYVFNLWLSEKKYFIPWNKFPYSSTTGNWRDVGNYTQLVWGNSYELGCASASTAKKFVLVCRYNQPGNYLGLYPYLNQTKPVTSTSPTTTTTTPSTTTTTPTPSTTTTTTTTTPSTTTTPTTSSTPSTTANTTASTTGSTNSTSANITNNGQPWFAARILDLHNIEKMSINYANYTWSDDLYKSAQSWADYLASSYNFYHSGTANVGENIATATIRNTDMVAYMFNLWQAEKKYFIPWKRFPDCSSTGNWGDVGHYTQIVWGMSTQLGCGLGVNSGNNVLVCQYSLAGNYIGNYVYLNRTSIN